MFVMMVRYTILVFLDICLKEAKALQTEQEMHMPLIHHPTSQPSLDINPMWTAAEVKTLHLPSL
jgi:hypothetical protein